MKASYHFIFTFESRSQPIRLLQYQNAKFQTLPVTAKIFIDLETPFSASGRTKTEKTIVSLVGHVLKFKDTVTSVCFSLSQWLAFPHTGDSSTVFFPHF